MYLNATREKKKTTQPVHSIPLWLYGLWNDIAMATEYGIIRMGTFNWFASFSCNEIFIQEKKKNEEKEEKVQNSHVERYGPRVRM